MSQLVKNFNYPNLIQAISEIMEFFSPVVVFFDRGHPSINIPEYVIRMKSYADSFLDPTCVPHCKKFFCSHLQLTVIEDRKCTNHSRPS